MSNPMEPTSVYTSLVSHERYYNSSGYGLQLHFHWHINKLRVFCRICVLFTCGTGSSLSAVPHRLFFVPCKHSWLSCTVNFFAVALRYAFFLYCSVQHGLRRALSFRRSSRSTSSSSVLPFLSFRTTSVKLDFSTAYAPQHVHAVENTNICCGQHKKNVTHSISSPTGYAMSGFCPQHIPTIYVRSPQYICTHKLYLHSIHPQYKRRSPQHSAGMDTRTGYLMLSTIYV